MIALWAFLKGVAWPFVRATWPVWALIAAALLAYGWLGLHDHALVEHTTEEVAADRDAYWKALFKKANDAADARYGELQHQLETTSTEAAQSRQRLLEQLNAARVERDAARAALDRDRRTNVTPEAARLCTLTRGVILQFNAGANRANGVDPSAAGTGARSAPAAGAVDAPAGVALDQYAAAVDETHLALKAAREQVLGWQAWYANVLLPWVSATQESFSTCQGG